MKNYFKHFSSANKGASPVVKTLLVIFLCYVIYKFFATIISSPSVIIKIPLFIFCVMIHEVAHGYIAYLCGDTTAKSKGRLTLNPLKHIDIVGLVLPLVLILTGSSFVIGWAKPVPVDYRNFKNGRIGEFFVSIAGVTSNLLMAFIAAVIIKYFHFTMDAYYITPLLYYVISLNFVLAVFNLIPVPPLDGSKVLASILPKELRGWIFELDRYGFLFILLLSFTGLLYKFIAPLYGYLVKLVEAFIQ